MRHGAISRFQVRVATGDGLAMVDGPDLSAADFDRLTRRFASTKSARAERELASPLLPRSRSLSAERVADRLKLPARIISQNQCAEGR
ncbi:hypothetical protein C7I87_17860 [Mesorhizobium sp. SARCC-RB16n]|nr:hypothetical protein C7I87_17860 [Mesorhizobium sp. SARCC-RB16n]